MHSRFSFFQLLLLISSALMLSISINSHAATPKKPQKNIEKIAPSSTETIPVSSARKAERLYFAEAQKALKKNQMSLYKQILPKLKNYPLLPYLEYQELSDRLMALPRQDVAQFFAKYPDSFSAERLRQRWLRTLAMKELWAEYLTAYDSSIDDTELACIQIQARLATNDTTALKDVEALWNVGKPQPKGCDYIFSEWKQAGQLTPALLWSRHTKAVQTNEISLAVSLAQAMTPTQQSFALQYQNVAQTPRLIFQSTYFNTKTMEARASILMGLEKYAQTDVLAALELWKSYEKHGGFTEDETIQINYVLAKLLLRQDKTDTAEQLVLSTPNLSNSDVLEALIRESLRNQDWGKSYRWFLRLPPETQKTERWSYWQARMMEQLNIKEIEGKKTNDIYASLANTRSFYGFLSADKLGANYNLEDKPLNLSKDFIKSVEASPGIQRAREFYALGEMPEYNREWSFTMRHFTNEEVVAAGRLADKWGWHGQAIQTMGNAKLWDELQVRFPLVYSENVKNASRATSVSEHFIFAITRQESAFRSDAKSTVGATGLMQLMPGTAKDTAKKSGLNYKEQDLLHPEKNINLGSRYLDQLLGSFSGNRILVAAAYNAGPSRVKQWLSKNEDEKLDYDVWIETIPYKETRNYVQNILSFSVIYGYRTGIKQPFITEHEAAQGL